MSNLIIRGLGDDKTVKKDLVNYVTIGDRKVAYMIVQGTDDFPLIIGECTDGPYALLDGRPGDMGLNVKKADFELEKKVREALENK